MTASGVAIGLIDSGVQAAHPHLAGVPVEAFSVRDGDEDGGPRDERPRDDHGHGTAVAAAIAHWGPPCVRVISARVLDATLTARHARVVQACDTLVDRGASVINLSLAIGTRAGGRALAAAVARATRRGAVVVAAVGAEAPSWPADLDGVLGAVADPRLAPGRCRRVQVAARDPWGRPTRPWRFAVHGRPRGAQGRFGDHPFDGASLAAAQLTALVARGMATRSDGDVEGLAAWLTAGAVDGVQPGES